MADRRGLAEGSKLSRVALVQVAESLGDRFAIRERDHAIYVRRRGI
jgi:hypothetical protein